VTGPSATAGVAFYFVDVFARRPLEGNPLSLVPDADALSEGQLRAIAREFNQSETTFLLRPTRPGATWRLRSFTPIGTEVFGAGHNALGAWLWLARSGRLDGVGPDLAQEIGPDLLPVEVHADGGAPSVWMDQSKPEFGALAADRAELATSLGLPLADLDPAAPAQVVSTGAGHLLVPVRDRAAVDRARPDAPRLAAALALAEGEGCYVYSRDPVGPDSAAYARFFNPTMGIAEDPATGTAAGPLVAQLVALGQLPDDIATVVEQGHALGRPSRIGVTVAGLRVRVGGSGVVAAHGMLNL
jgi:trans-2,3-dihydro-3-hydroxyanthranilate isomerase